MREVLRGAETLLFYRPAGGEKAHSAHASARYGGTGGNAIQIVIRENGEQFDVATVVDGVEADVQTVSTAEELQDNDLVTFTDEALAATAGEPLTGGTDKTAEKADYEAFLRAIEPYTFQTLGCASEDEEINNLFVSFTPACARSRASSSRRCCTAPPPTMRASSAWRTRRRRTLPLLCTG